MVWLHVSVSEGGANDDFEGGVICDRREHECMKGVCTRLLLVCPSKNSLAFSHVCTHIHLCMFVCS